MRRQIQAITVKSLCSKRIDRVAVEADHGDCARFHPAPRYLAAAATAAAAAGALTGGTLTTSTPALGDKTSMRFAADSSDWSSSSRRQPSRLRNAGTNRLMRWERLERPRCSPRG